MAAGGGRFVPADDPKGDEQTDDQAHEADPGCPRGPRARGVPRERLLLLLADFLYRALHLFLGSDAALLLRQLAQRFFDLILGVAPT